MHATQVENILILKRGLFAVVHLLRFRVLVFWGLALRGNSVYFRLVAGFGGLALVQLRVVQHALVAHRKIAHDGDLSSVILALLCKHAPSQR